MEIEFGQLSRSVRRLWWVPLALALVFGLLGFGGGFATGSTSYTATTQMLVTEQISGDAVLSEGSRTQTYIVLVTSGPVLDRVILELGLDYTREELIEDVVDAHVISGTQIIEISVTTDDPELSAEIANSLSRNFVVTATDLSIGELQRNLDDLRQQSNTVQDQITVIETRLGEIDIEDNADDSQIQAEISQLERERLQASQTLADLDRSIRGLTTSLNTTSIPIVVTDFAKAPEEGEGSVSPVLLGLLGAFLGVMVGVAWITWVAATDRTLRAPEHIVSLPLLAHIEKAHLNSADPGVVSHLAAKLIGVRNASGAEYVLVSPRNSTVADELRAALVKEEPEKLGSMVAADSALTEAAAMKAASAADHVVVVAEVDSTRLDDLEELEQVLTATNTRVLGTILVD